VYELAVPFMLPLVIFLAETCVVTISTVRIISVSRGRKVLASVLGTFEITIWLFAISQVMKNLNDWTCFVAFAAGFTIGNFLGVMLEARLAIGNLVVRVITHRNGDENRPNTASPASTPRVRPGRCKSF
jgi:uncharacterized protein YebE (UPF0316 family)